MKCAVVVFPGTNCDVDTLRACEYVKWEPKYVLHDETDLSDFDVVILPGGFSSGDYINSARLTKFTPIMQAVKEFVDQKKGFVLGVCSGFQLLCECDLLPGTLVSNDCNKFICDDIELIFTEYNVNRTIVLPIAHSEGNYYADPRTLTELDDKNMVFLRYKLNPNGSVSNIAGLYDSEKMIIGLMPHPERAIFKELGLTDGKRIFDFIESELNDARCKNT